MLDGLLCTIRDAFILSELFIQLELSFDVFRRICDADFDTSRYTPRYNSFQKLKIIYDFLICILLNLTLLLPPGPPPAEAPATNCRLGFGKSLSMSIVLGSDMVTSVCKYLELLKLYLISLYLLGLTFILSVF